MMLSKSAEQLLHYAVYGWQFRCLCYDISTNSNAQVGQEGRGAQLQAEKQLRSLFLFLSPIQSGTVLGQCSELFRLLMTGYKVFHR